MRYDAFISYSHSADGQLAPALQAGLQRLARPWYRRRALRVFRDETGLAVNPHLWDSIAGAMAESRYFVLLASPDAAASRWVNLEIEQWLATHSVETVLPVLTEGTLVWNPDLGDFDPAESTALPTALAGAFVDEPRHLDVRWGRDETHLDLRHSRFRAQVATLAAPMHGIARDDLEGEDVRLHRRALRLAWGGAAALVLLTVGALLAAGFAVSYARTASDQRHRAVVLGARATRQGTLAKDNARLAKAQKRTAEANATRAATNATEAQKQTVLAERNAAEATANANEAAANGAQAQAKAIEAATNAAEARRNATAAQRSADAAKAAAAAAEQQRVRAVASESTAVAQRKLADANAKTALSRQLAAEALYNIDPHPDLSLLEAVEAHVVQPTREAVRSLVQGLLTHPEVRQLLSTSPTLPTGVQMAPDGRLLAVQLGDGTVQLWDLTRGKPLDRQPSGTGPLALGPSGLIAQTVGTDVRILDAISGAERTRIPVDPMRTLTKIVFTPDGTELRVATTADPPDAILTQTLSRWDITRSTPRLVATAVDVGAGDWAFSPDGTKIAWGDPETGIFVRDAGGAQLGPLVAPVTNGNATFGATALSTFFFSADGQTLVSASSQTDVTFWNSVTGVPTTLGVASNSQSVLAVSADQRVVAVGDSSDHLRFIDSTNGNDVRAPVTLPVGSLDDAGAGMRIDVSGAFTPDAKTLVLAGPDNLVRLIDVAPTEPPLGHHLDFGPGDTTVSPDGTRAAVNSGSDIKVVDLGSGKIIGIHPRGGAGEGAAFGPNGTVAWADVLTGTVTVWDPATGSGYELATGFEFVTGIVFSPDGHEIAVEGVSLTAGNQALFYDARTGTPLVAQPAIDGVVAVAFSPDGTTATSNGNEIQLRSLGQPARVLTDAVCAVDGGLSSLEFSPDGSTLAVGCMTTIELRSTASGALRVPALEMGDGPNGSDPGFSLRFSRDGSLLAGGDIAGSLRVWDAVSGQLLGTPLAGRTAPVASLGFTDAGKLVSASAQSNQSGVSSEVIRWDFDPSSLERRACTIANRELTPDEWTQVTGNAAPYVSCAAILATPSG